jgi:hypothetical protein
MTCRLRRGGREAAGRDVCARRGWAAGVVSRACAVEGAAGRDRASGRAAVERRLDAGLRVLALHPNQVAAARPRFRVAGGKSDRFDAFVLCELARTDSHRFRVLEPESDETKALRALTGAREDLVHATVALVNQLRSQLECSGPARSACSPGSTARSRWRSWSATRARSTREALESSAWRRSSPAGTTAAARSPRSCSQSSRRAPEARVGEAEHKARRQLVLGLVATLKPLIAQVRQLERQIAPAVRAHPDGEIFSRCSKTPTVLSRPASCWPRSATAARATQPPTRSPAMPAKPRSRSSPASARQRAFAGAATSDREQRSARCPTAHATGPPGRKTASPPPELAATTTPARCAPSAAPGAASHGAAGRTASPTIPPATAACTSTSWSRFPHRRAPGPDLAATQPMAGAAVTEMAARRAEPEALDGNPTSAISLRG